jgi:hypothetical protein
MSSFSNNQIYKFEKYPLKMAPNKHQLDDKKLDDIIDNTQKDLALFNFDDTDRVDSGRDVPMPKEILTQYLDKKYSRKHAIENITGEFILLYNTKERNKASEIILVPVSNYENKDKMSKQHREYLQNLNSQSDINLKPKNGEFVLDGIPIEFRPKGNVIRFKAHNEPYIHLETISNRLI